MGTQNVLGVNYPYPDPADKPWGPEHIDWATAVSDATNTLQAEVDNINNVEIPNLQAQINMSGQANTSSNEGSGQGLAMPKVGVNLPFKTLVAGTNISLVPTPDTIVISSTGTGDVNGPAASLDTTIPVFDGVTGKLLKMSGVTIDSSDNIIVPGNLTVNGDVIFSGTGTFTVTAEFANSVIDAYTRPSGSTVGLRGFAKSSIVNSSSVTGTSDTSIGATITITSSGRPIRVGLLSGISGLNSRIIVQTSTVGLGANKAVIKIKRDGSTVATFEVSAGADPIRVIELPVAGINHLDEVAAGTYTYTCTIAMLNSNSPDFISISSVILSAYEI